MKGIIIYKSKYGSTKKYAEWLKEATGFEMVEADKAKIDEAARCDTIIFGGGIYAGGIAGVNFLKKNIAKLKGKKIVAFCCGASPFDAGFFNALKERNFSGDLSGIPHYYCRGGYDLASMHFMDKTLCKLLGKSVAKKDPAEREVWETALVDSAGAAHDWTDRAFIDPIIKECKTA